MGGSGASGVTAGVSGEREGNAGEDGADRWGRPSSERARGERGWAGSGCCSVFGPQVRPSWAVPFSFLFFSVSFSCVFCFFLIYVLE
jgi:hypothetical protein